GGGGGGGGGGSRQQQTQQGDCELHGHSLIGKNRLSPIVAEMSLTTSFSARSCCWNTWSRRSRRNANALPRKNFSPKPPVPAMPLDTTESTTPPPAASTKSKWGIDPPKRILACASEYSRTASNISWHRDLSCSTANVRSNSGPPLDV